MRMRQYGLLKSHRGIFCELFMFTTSICRLTFVELNVFFKVSRHFHDASNFIVAWLSLLRGQSFLSLNSTSKTRWQLNAVTTQHFAHIF